MEESKTAGVVLIELEQVRAKTGLGTTRIYEKIGEGTFPRPIKDGILSRWVLQEVEDWCQARIRERDATPFTPKPKTKKPDFASLRPAKVAA